MVILLNTYLQSKCHSARDFTVHLCFLKYLIVLVSAGLTNIDDTPRKGMLQRLDGFEEDIKGDWGLERSLGLFDNHILDVD